MNRNERLTWTMTIVTLLAAAVAVGILELRVDASKQELDAQKREIAGFYTDLTTMREDVEDMQARVHALTAPDGGR